ncbi:C6 zinc finger domain-containing protein, partial [Metarhizium brunneum ARSEF 3297]
MPRQQRKKRTPVSCEACRERKIRCTRDGPPCATCIHRRVPLGHCIYSVGSGHSPLQSAPAHAARPPESSHAVDDNSLASRVEALERIVRLQPTPGSAAGTASLSTGDADMAPVASGLKEPCPGPCNSDQTGTLITSSSGHVRFLPVASTWNIIQGASPDVSLPDQGNTVTDTPGAPYPFSRRNAESQSAILAMLPPPEFCHRLKDVYFQAVGPIFPIIHAPRFSKRYHRFTSDAEGAPMEWLALLFAVLGTAVLAVDMDSPLLPSLSRKDTVLGRVTQLSERYYSAAIKCLDMDHYLWRHNLTTLQTLLLIIYGIHHSRGQTWTLLGLAYHLALSVGCHVDPSAFSLDTVSCEERRRSWLALMMLLCNQNMSMAGFDILHTAKSFSIQLPAEALDQDLPDGAHPPPGQAGLTPVGYFIRKYRLFQLSSEICSLSPAKQQADPTLLRRLDAALRLEQDRLTQIRDNASGASDVFRNLLLSFSHHLIVLLHCRVFRRPAPSADDDAWSKECCWDSARQVLALHADFARLPAFKPHRWYIRGRGAFHAFHAAVVLVLLVSADKRGSPSAEVMQALGNCLQCLESFGTQSQICARSASILGHLLTKVTNSTSPSQSQGGNVEAGVQTSSAGLVPVDDASSSGAQVRQQPERHGGGGLSMDGVDLNNLLGNFAPGQWLDADYIDWQQLDMFMPWSDTV